MKIRYDCTLEDFITTQMFISERMASLKKADRRTTVRGAGLLVCFGIVLNSIVGGMNDFTNWVPVAGMILVWLFLRRKGRHQKLLYRRLKIAYEPLFKDTEDKSVTWEVDSEGITIVDASKTIRLEWEQVTRITLAPEILAVYSGEMFCAALPAKPFVEGDYASFHRYLVDMYQTRCEQLGKGNLIESSVWQVNIANLAKKGPGRLTFKKAACWMLVVLAGTWFLYYTSGKRGFEKRVNALARAGYPVTMEALERQYVLPDGVENAADVYLKAFAAYQEPARSALPLLPTVGSYVLADDAVTYPQEVMDAIKTYLDNNQQTLALLDEAATIKYCLLPRSFDLKDSEPYSLPIRQVLKLLFERNLYLAQTHQAEAIFKSLQTTLRVIEIQENQPRLIDLHLSIALKSAAADNLEDVLNLTRLSEGQLAVLQEQLSMMYNPGMLQQALINERCVMMDFCYRPLLEKLEFYSDLKQSDKIKLRLSSLSGLYFYDINSNLDHIAQLLEVTQLPSQEWFDYYKQRQKEIEHSKLGKFSSVNMISYHRVLMTDLRVQAARACTKTALAIERYRLAEGKLPDSLEVLVPEYLEAVPIDPFDGQPFKYLVHPEGGFSVYSIDEDQIDNNGVDRSQMRKKGIRDQGDIVFTIKR